jgi:hypothetical protein
MIILALLFFYLLALYYYALKVDFVRTRFLLVPAFLLYPWVGAGLKRFWLRIQNSSMQTMLAVIFAGLFIVSPVFKIARSIEKKDDVIVRAAKWIKAQPDLINARIVTNDPRIAFYAGRETYTRKRKDAFIYLAIRYDFSGIENFAIENRGDVIIIRISAKRLNQLPDFRNYIKVKEFKNRKKLVIIFYSQKETIR